jgi:hypothetical protein
MVSLLEFRLDKPYHVFPTQHLMRLVSRREWLIMDITPRVNQDGLIVMNVALERSALSNTDSVEISDGVFQQIINRTQADTVISAYNGQTVVFAGLITKQRESASRRIPYLADIPVLGLLFRSDFEVEKRSELLIVMTPRLANMEEEVNILKEVESSRMSWCLADILEMHGDVGLNGGHGLWGPAAGAMMYPELPQSVIDGAEEQSIIEEQRRKREAGEVIEGEPIPAVPDSSGVVNPMLIDPAGYYGNGDSNPTQAGFYSQPNAAQRFQPMYAEPQSPMQANYVPNNTVPSNTFPNQPMANPQNFQPAQQPNVMRR